MISINGYIDPVGVDSGFMIPTFTKLPSNARYIQKRDSIFSEIELKTIDVEKAEIFVPLHEPVNLDSQGANSANNLSEEYFAFKHLDKYVVGSVDEVSSFLKSILSELESFPVLYFEVVRFLNDEENFPAAFAVAYAHIGTSFSKESADNWQDTQVFLPAIYKAIHQSLFKAVSEVKGITVSSSGNSVRVVIQTTKGFNLNSKQNLFLQEVIKTYDPELIVEVGALTESNSWERITSQEIKKEEIMPEESDIERKIREMAGNLERYDPEKLKKEADELRKIIPNLIKSADSFLVDAFENRIISKLSDIKTIGYGNGLHGYSRRITISVPVVQNKSVYLLLIAEPLDIIKTTIKLYTSHPTMSNTRQLQGDYIVSDQTELDELKGTIIKKAQTVLNEAFVLSFEGEIEKFKK